MVLKFLVTVEGVPEEPSLRGQENVLLLLVEQILLLPQSQVRLEHRRTRDQKQIGLAARTEIRQA